MKHPLSNDTVEFSLKEQLQEDFKEEGDNLLVISSKGPTYFVLLPDHAIRVYTLSFLDEDIVWMSRTYEEYMKESIYVN